MGYKFTLRRVSENRVLGHLAQDIDAAIVALARRVVIEDLSWYVPQYTPSISNQNLMLKQVVSKTPTQLSFMKRSAYMIDKSTENTWSCELGVEDGIDVAFHVIVEFKRSN